MFRFISKAVLVLVVILGLAGSGLFFYLKHKLPMTSGRLAVDQLLAEASISRDQWGVPHIRAENPKDAYFALGFTLAQDRLFQMELQRRLAKGELAEILGPKVLDLDKKFRTLMLGQTAARYLAQETAILPQALSALDAFLAGVNHFVATQPLPVEFVLLGITPRPFTRLDTVAVLGYVAYSFADGIKRDALHTILAAKLTKEDLALVFPDYSTVNRVTVMEPQGVPPVAVGKKGEGPTPGSEAFAAFSLAYEALLDRTGEIFAPFTGSNSWVLAPERSQSGHALLANDPHIGIANPGVWYEAHLEYPGYENYGYHLPLVPFPMLAHNRTKAWAITMFENDDLDLYAETFDPQDPMQVRFQGEWTRVETLTETIKVKGEADQDLVIRITPHGPVISDFIPGYQGPPVSMAWVYHKVTNPILDVMYEMGQAGDLGSFQKAVSRLAAPGLNISYIDARGNIGWWAAGRIPIRPAHMSGLEIHDGAWGRDEHQGYLPFEKNPQLVNPENGLIITANNLSTLTPIEGVGILTGYFRPSDRAARIYELLTQREKWDQEGLKQIQTDTRLYSGPRMAQAILKALGPHRPDFSPLEARAFEQLESWDGFMETGSIGGTVFQFTTYQVLAQALVPHLGADLFKAYLDQVDHWSFLKLFLESEKTIQGLGKTPGPRPKEEIILEGFKAAVAEMSQRLGSDPALWTWGAVHTIEFAHPLGKKKPLNHLLNIGPLACPAEFTSVNKLKSKTGNHDYKVASIPSTRRLINCNDPADSWSILPTGNSGNFMSRFYQDQVKMFVDGQYRRILLTPAQYEGAEVLTLTPR